MPLWLAAPACANDRPFQVARTAVAEEDEQGWSFESWATRLGTQRSLSVEPEYRFNPRDSVQMELTRRVDRQGLASGHEVEAEYKRLFGRIGQSGVSLGFSAAMGIEREGPSTARQNARTWTLKLPVSIEWAGEHGPRLHLNAGGSKTTAERATGVAAVAAEWAVHPQWMVFAEWSAQRAERFSQAGVRWWVTPEKLALDIAALRDEDGRHRAGVTIGIGLGDF